MTEIRFLCYNTIDNLYYRFEMENPSKGGKHIISVEKYFKLVRNYTIKYPNLPCLHVGNVEKKTAVPIEVSF